MPKKRNNWTYLVEQVGNGNVDLGETGFTFNPSRYKMVDLSLGILSVSYTLAYVPNTDILQVDLFRKPCDKNSWIAVFVFITLVIIGSFSLGMISKRLWKNNTAINVPENII